ncbi:transposase [Avibacterium paragallinarum]|uniref:transposase n=1 Tax=Avibacterium paragallinarum TaxID=728 RepID=UPI0021F74E0B|nr:transposase [Avibacterium paragallinarum]UXN34893.1 transposase [Avibacterium paragallinarum]
MQKVKGLKIKCPECGKALNIRTSERPSACVTQASVYCVECDIKATVTAQLGEIKKGVFQPVKPSHKWQQDPKR